MLPQSCSEIHDSLTNELLSNNKTIESSKTFSLFNNIWCFDYLINLEEYFSDNMIEIYFYKKFIKVIYELDKQNILDFHNYHIDSLTKFIKILNKISSYYYSQRKIKFSKYLCNLSVKISQIIFKPENEMIDPINLYKNNGQFLNDLNSKYLVSNIYNNTCCNYFKTFSYNKCLKFLEYSYKNIDENNINDKMIYYNNLIIIANKNILVYDKVNSSIKILEQLIQSRKNYFDNFFCDNSYCNNGDNSENIKKKLKLNDENYNSFKLLCFIIYNYILIIENILKQKEQAKNLYKVNYEYVSKFLGRSSFEAQKFLIRLKDDIKIKTMNYRLDEENNSFEKENKEIKEKNYKNKSHSEKDINLRLNNILEKIEEFEGILQNEKIMKIIKEKNFNNENEIINKDNNNIIKKDNILADDKNFDDNLTLKNKDNNFKIKNNFGDINEVNNNDKKEKIDPQKKEKEIITFDMMDNIIEEFKKESQEKLDIKKKLEEEKEKKRLENINMPSNINNLDLKPSKTENLNDNSSPKKAPKIKKLFQKVIGTTQKQQRKSKLGELFQTLMDNKHENKNEENNKNEIKIEDKKDEIKVGKENDNNLINLDEEDDIKDNEDKINNEEKKDNKEDIDVGLGNNQNWGYGFKINVHLDPSSYSYEANTLYQENEN